mmetsp:Transcript_524/g.948  ORF Transcript_524/g.948 Transcript_524/m.948 type:complete len:581 (-) Transcript_524:143-1885(-)
MELSTMIAFTMLLSASHCFTAYAAAAAAAPTQTASTWDFEVCSGTDCSVTDAAWDEEENLSLIQRAASMMQNRKVKDSQNEILKEQKSKQTAQSVGIAAPDSGSRNDSRQDSAMLTQITSNHTKLHSEIDAFVEKEYQGAQVADGHWPVNHASRGMVWEILEITAFPATAMTIGSTAIYLGRPPEMLQLRLQHLSAGLLIGACLTNIFPILQQQLTGTTFKRQLAGRVEERVIHWYNVLAAGLGFGLAMAAMYGVKSLELDHDEGESEDEKDETDEGVSRERAYTGTVDGDVTPHEGIKLRMTFTRLAAHANSLAESVQTDQIDREAVDEEIHGIDFLVDSARRITKGADPIDKRNAARLRFHVSELIDDVRKLTELDVGGSSNLLDRQLKVVAATLTTLHSHAESASFRRWRPANYWKPPELKSDIGEEIGMESCPWALILAVVLDSFVDGMLIGLAASVATGSGILMAIATAIEMGFLGYSFACSIVQSLRPCRASLVLALPPLAMLFAATAAGMGATIVEGTPAFVALIAFALVALLFLVVDELLSEAKEKEESGEWHVGIWLYLGLIASILLDVII